eukprot:Rmarinus@m.1610
MGKRSGGRPSGQRKKKRRNVNKDPIRSSAHEANPRNATKPQKPMHEKDEEYSSSESEKEQSGYDKFLNSLGQNSDNSDVCDGSDDESISNLDSDGDYVEVDEDELRRLQARGEKVEVVSGPDGDLSESDEHCSESESTGSSNQSEGGDVDGGSEPGDEETRMDGEGLTNEESGTGMVTEDFRPEDLAGAEADILDDPYDRHYGKSIPESAVADLLPSGKVPYGGKFNATDLSVLGDVAACTKQCADICASVRKQKSGSSPGFLIGRLQKHWENYTSDGSKRPKGTKGHVDGADGFTARQRALYAMFSEYRDVLCCLEETPADVDEFREASALHVLNHVLKTRNRRIRHSARCSDPKNKENPDFEPPRDQGYTRAQVLVLVPIRSCALKFVQKLIELAPESQVEQIENKSRFFKEFGDEDDEDDEDKAKAANSATAILREDRDKWLQGNTDDCFRIGISFTRKSMKLYSVFYTSDIIVASPAGLRLACGEENTKKHNVDFLSSIEVCVVDQAGMMRYQNWAHVYNCLRYLNTLPKSDHGADFSRVFEWALSGHAKHYRQTLLFSDAAFPELNALFARQCTNYEGKIRVQRTYPTGSISRVVPPVVQVFRRVADGVDRDGVDQARFQYFTTKVLPKLQDTLNGHVLIYVPTYFSFLEVRRHFRQLENDMGFNFNVCSEYSKISEVSRARSLFSQGRTKFLLITERFHYFFRYFLRGVKHVVFYGPPESAQFYADVVNFISGSDVAVASCLCLYTKYDRLQLERILGSKRADLILSSDKPTHAYS